MVDRLDVDVHAIRVVPDFQQPRAGVGKNLAGIVGKATVAAHKKLMVVGHAAIGIPTRIAVENTVVGQVGGNVFGTVAFSAENAACRNVYRHGNVSGKPGRCAFYFQRCACIATKVSGNFKGQGIDGQGA